MRVKAPRGARPECSAAQRHLPGLVRAHRRDAAAARALLRRLRPADDRRSVGCAAVAELEAPPAQTGLQLEVTFEEPDDKVPVTFITTTARVVSSAFRYVSIASFAARVRAREAVARPKH